MINKSIILARRMIAVVSPEITELEIIPAVFFIGMAVKSFVKGTLSALFYSFLFSRKSF
jgi:hypothetical protein